MKKFIGILMLLMVASFAHAQFWTFDGSRSQMENLGSQLSRQAAKSVPVPQVMNFVERQTVARWIRKFDVPQITTYIYLLSYGNFIGYYVTYGKPVSTRSYLIPEDELWSSGVTSMIAVDGTFGEDNPGIRFFTPDGNAVEWGGVGATYLYSTAPLPIKNVPQLNVVQTQTVTK